MRIGVLSAQPNHSPHLTPRQGKQAEPTRVSSVALPAGRTSHFLLTLGQPGITHIVFRIVPGRYTSTRAVTRYGGRLVRGQRMRSQFSSQDWGIAVKR